MKLSELHVGDLAEVSALGSEPIIRRRLMDLGLIRGTVLKVLRVAPLGDPVEIVYKGLYLTLRKTEAEEIGVNLIESCKASSGRGRRMRAMMRFGRAS
jgi:ferrous iron transport protein A